MIEAFGAPPVGADIAIPVDAAGEAGSGEGVDEHFHLVFAQNAFAAVTGGIVGRDHVGQCEIGLRRRADAGRRLFIAGKGVETGGALRRLAHEEIEGAADVIGEDAIGPVRGILELDDIHAVAEPLAIDRDRIDRRAVRMRRVDADDAGDALGMPQRHLPNDEAAPVVADEDRLVDLQMIEQGDQIAGEMFDTVALDGAWLVGGAIAALVRRDDTDASFAQRLDLVPPGECEFGPAVAEDHRRRVGLWTGVVVAHAEAGEVGILERRHFNHYLLHGAVIARSEATKQSSSFFMRLLDCFVALRAPRNDDRDATCAVNSLAGPSRPNTAPAIAAAGSSPMHCAARPG